MKPYYYSDDWLTVYGGDCREVMATMPADSVDCVVTSPPYWGLRDYGTEGQLGLERTPEEYVANLVAVFAEVRRVLKPAGTCWLNLGDSYASGKTENTNGTGGKSTLNYVKDSGVATYKTVGMKVRAREYGHLAHKQLVGIPWRVAFALQADGWYLRSDIIWSKPNPMPESVTDRPTKAHEYLFLLTKSARYYFDADAVSEPARRVGEVMGGGGGGFAGGDPTNDARYRSGLLALGTRPVAATRNIRSVWNIATRPYPGAHFAVFPPELPERCIKAGSPEGGLILDCFAGSGTVGMVANRLSRRAILIDLNPEYLRQQMTRNAQTPLGLGAA